MNNINMDDFFADIYGWKPIKRGAGYELLVGAVLKILNKEASIANNVFVRSEYSADKFQSDILIEQEDSTFVEAKDYASKVGREDVQKLAGALLVVPQEKGMVATGGGFTRNAIQYVKDCQHNPSAKPIDLYIIRPSTEGDIKGRVTEIHIKLIIESMDYAKAKFEPSFTEEAAKIFGEMGFKKDEKLSFKFDGFYRSDGSVIETFRDLTSNKLVVDPQGGGYSGEWRYQEKTFIKVRDRLVPINYLAYHIPITLTKEKIVSKAGEPCILVRSNDGSIDKIISKEELKRIKFEKDEK